MLRVTDLRRIARARLRDAEILSRARCFDGSVYVCGYAVEIALKARICRTLRWTGSPDSSAEFSPPGSASAADAEAMLRSTRDILGAL